MDRLCPPSKSGFEPRRKTKTKKGIILIELQPHIFSLCVSKFLYAFLLIYSLKNWIAKYFGGMLDPDTSWYTDQILIGPIHKNVFGAKLKKKTDPDLHKLLESDSVRGYILLGSEKVYRGIAPIYLIMQINVV